MSCHYSKHKASCIIHEVEDVTKFISSTNSGTDKHKPIHTSASLYKHFVKTMTTYEMVKEKAKSIHKHKENTRGRLSHAREGMK